MKQLNAKKMLIVKWELIQNSILSKLPKYKKKEMHMKLHQSKPDWDNLSKAFFDGLMSEDKYIADVRVTKRWVNAEEGYIEFISELPNFPSKDVLI
jgi:Holliday junction resolvase RusA-like endonuclease